MSAGVAVAVALTALAVFLVLWGPGALPAAPAGGPAPPSVRRLGPRLAILAVVGAVAASSPRAGVLALIAVGVVTGALRLVRRARQARVAAAHHSQVVELCDALQAELAAGQTAAQALDRAAADWPLVGPAARAAASGGDVTASLRELATEPGAGSLRVVAAAWQVAHRTGHGLADALGRVADDLRAVEQTRRVVAGELASARATARLLAVLPFLALAMGAGAGAEPWAFLLGHPAGLACLAAGLGLAWAGLAWVEAIARGVDGG
ncbi:type II secretion system F family protein [Nocardioides sp. J9]|uniref:type II secretion system F family protein n=1 Tax=Nocardioides sp. J9 TaxID=935844 RepID=UPI00119EBCCC|nr:type II secretion system F family protein [Nocardioides sp. J9]